MDTPVYSQPCDAMSATIFSSVVFKAMQVGLITHETMKKLLQINLCKIAHITCDTPAGILKLTLPTLALVFHQESSELTVDRMTRAIINALDPLFEWSAKNRYQIHSNHDLAQVRVVVPVLSKDGKRYEEMARVLEHGEKLSSAGSLPTFKKTVFVATGTDGDDT